MTTQHTIVLGSGSPRRQELLQSLGLTITVRVPEVDEIYPENTPAHEVAPYLAQLKANALLPSIKEHELLITSDTVVIQQQRVLGKPANKEAAFTSLKSLSNSEHEVVTGVFIGNNLKKKVFFETTKVFFKALSDEEINYYIEHFKPFDKAGSYGIQEWIGKIGVTRIEGCFYNVMGLPIGRLWDELKRFD